MTIHVKNLPIDKRIELYNKVKKLKEKGLGVRRISKKLNIPRGTVATWLRKTPKYITGECPKRFRWWDRHAPKYTEEEKKLIALGLDFEGCLGIYRWDGKEGKYAPHYQFLVCVASTSKPLIEKWQKIVKIGRVACIIPNSKKHKGWKDAYYWRLFSRGEILELLEQIEPYLVAKKEQASIMIKAIKGEIPLEEAVKKIRNLNRKGKRS